ncbi:hypothetical protein [Secundilactobacillus muriivasis]
MSESPKQPKIIPSGNFKATDKPVQYNFVLHQDKKKSYQPRHSVPAGQAVPVATQPATAPQQTHSARGWVIGILLVLGVIFWHPIWRIIYICVAFILIVFIDTIPWLIGLAIMFFIIWLIGDTGSGSGSGYGDSWEDGYYTGYDEYQLWHEYGHDNNDDYDGDGGSDWY